MMDIITDKKFILLIGLFALILGGIYFSPAHSGMLLILSLIVFGSFCLMNKESHIKLAGLALLLILAIANIGLNGLKYGIDFDGGTRIPVLLERPAGAEEMNELVQAIKKRVSVLGLTEAKVRAIGDSQINVEIPSSDADTIRFIEETLSHQGVYWGIIDGKIAVSGEDIYATSIRPLSAQQLAQGGGGDWGVSFSVNRKGAEQFAEVAKGKADYPVYMFLDRPNDAMLFISIEDLKANMPDDSSEKEAQKSLRQALELDSGRNISLYIIEELDLNSLPAPSTNKTQALLSKESASELKSALNASGYIIKEFEKTEVQPQYNRTNAGVLSVSKLESVGLLSAPLLSASLASGSASYGFSVTGSVPGKGPEKTKLAIENVKKIESILKGGSLPIQISLGSRTTLPATLGQEFLKLSLIGIAGALLAISILIGLRYRNIKATLPIIVISISELVILLSILGSFTIDLAAMAGIIAAIGVGVDAQIVITDEILKKSEEETEERIEHAFAIIKTNVIVASLSMIPLLFSGLVEIIGFAISTILGSLLGYLLSRPAYAAIVERIVRN
jgi:preprotein translocase subunit SecD